MIIGPFLWFLTEYYVIAIDSSFLICRHHLHIYYSAPLHDSLLKMSNLNFFSNSSSHLHLEENQFLFFIKKPGRVLKLLFWSGKLLIEHKQSVKYLLHTKWVPKLQLNHKISHPMHKIILICRKKSGYCVITTERSGNPRFHGFW